jgi:hypothetical protein
MSKPFDRLGERLLSAGIAPRNVHRYLAELEDHLADLTTEYNADGVDRHEADIMARARLGTTDNLAQAMIAQPALRSWAARAPWAAFVLGPLLGWIAASAAGMTLLIAIVQAHRAAPEAPTILPGWFGALETGITGLSLYILPVLIGWAIASIALRQRIAAGWPLAGLTLIAVIGGGTQIDLSLPTAPGTHGELSVGMGLLPPYSDFANSLARILANLALTLPAYWALRRQALSSRR